MGWDEKTQSMASGVVAKMAPGVSWVYNWGPAPKLAETFSSQSDVAFVPMAWNANFDETKIRNFYTQHPEVKVLLGFNEPNFSSQANMTPAQAVAAWPKLEQIASDFGLKLVAPALNFTGEKVGGRTWSPFEWYDEFFRLYPTAKVDYLAMHCYMNWAENVDWICSRYFYTDKEEEDLYYSTNRTKYPNLVKYLDDYKTAHGHFPQMYLTEFCSWEDGVYPYRNGLTEDFQIDQMTQKLQYMEKSPQVAGYAWFMANPSGGVSDHPHESILVRNTSDSELSALGKVYVYLSTFDSEKYYIPGEQIQAKDYIDASLNDVQVRVRPNTETGSSLPLQVQWGSSSWMSYQMDIATAGQYELTLHMQSSAASSFRLYRNATGSANRLTDTTELPSTGGQWKDVTTTVTLPAGRYALLIYNMSTTTVLVNALQLKTATGIESLTPGPSPKGEGSGYYTLDGRKLLSQPTKKGLYIVNGRKVLVP